MHQYTTSPSGRVKIHFALSQNVETSTKSATPTILVGVPTILVVEVMTMIVNTPAMIKACHQGTPTSNRIYVVRSEIVFTHF